MRILGGKPAGTNIYSRDHHYHSAITKQIIARLPAGLEVVFFCQLIAIGGALAYSEIDGRQIRVELFVGMFPRKVRAFFHGLAALLSLGLFVILAWKTVQYALSLKAINDVTATARIPLYPFALWLAVCFVPLCLVLIGELLKAILECHRAGKTGHQWAGQKRPVVGG